MEQQRFLGNDMPKAVVKLEIPTVDKKLTAQDLLKRNLLLASLFPNLDGYALSLRHRFFYINTPQETEAEQQQKVAHSNYLFSVRSRWTSHFYQTFALAILAANGYV